MRLHPALVLTLAILAFGGLLTSAVLVLRGNDREQAGQTNDIKKVLVQKEIAVEGPQGIEGGRGPIGKRGRRGKTGRPGKPGRPGKSIRGPRGRAGRDGKDAEVAVSPVITVRGPKGADGKDGRPGSDGKDGRDGMDGKDGRDAPPAVSWTFTDATGVQQTCTDPDGDNNYSCAPAAVVLETP